jgi:hypothetical protein
MQFVTVYLFCIPHLFFTHSSRDQDKRKNKSKMQQTQKTTQNRLQGDSLAEEKPHVGTESCRHFAHPCYKLILRRVTIVEKACQYVWAVVIQIPAIRFCCATHPRAAWLLLTPCG